jgi:Pyridoxamine 5'-phosphate oxidase
MSKVHAGIDSRLRAWIDAQHLFFVATAPLDGAGHINVSPRGTPGSFAVIDETTVAWLDLTGSGAETIAHLRENGRVVIMFCAFEGPPQVVRLHGRGHAVLPADEDWQRLATYFPDQPGARAIIVVDVTRVSDSCGFAVPRFDFAGDRDLLERWTEARGPAGLRTYRATRNAASIDGLPALPSA